MDNETKSIMSSSYHSTSNKFNKSLHIHQLEHVYIGLEELMKMVVCLRKRDVLNQNKAASVLLTL